ncbi:MAG: hypothetical protein RI568_13090 [Natronomonas sp.]|uniref:hypothetical protein n=1 Tax=Natronomonas sp. TaxID=2184060 RepID=UPI002870250F|nr:hypothetical protein [Natronomonas sp.]MDR9431617.1 hypothetical protein [Natronomonas sp.]
MLESALAEFNYEQRVHGEVSEQTYAEFETEVLNMYEALEHQRDHDAAGETWQQFKMDQIPHICSQVRIERSAETGDFGIKKTGEETVIERAPPEYLKQWTRGFARMLNDLGLMTAVKQGIAANDVSHEDLAALLESRGQTEALDNSNVN